MKFNEIPQYICDGNYQVNSSLQFLKQNISEWLDEDGLELNPDFQRGHVWNEEQQIKWMEYYFRGGKSGRILYFNAPWWGHFKKDVLPYKDFVLVDGLQRITSFLKFLDNKIPIFDGHYYKDFEGRLRSARSCDNIVFNVNSLPTKADVLEWYIQMNSGGTPHTEDEIDKVRDLLSKEE